MPRAPRRGQQAPLAVSRLVLEPFAVESLVLEPFAVDPLAAGRSGVAPDPLRPTPSRPAFSHGLFLFPFQSPAQAPPPLVLSGHAASLTPY